MKNPVNHKMTSRKMLKRKSSYKKLENAKICGKFSYNGGQLQSLVVNPFNRILPLFSYVDNTPQKNRLVRKYQNGHLNRMLNIIFTNHHKMLSGWVVCSLCSAYLCVGLRSHVRRANPHEVLHFYFIVRIPNPACSTLFLFLKFFWLFNPLHLQSIVCSV